MIVVKFVVTVAAIVAAASPQAPSTPAPAAEVRAPDASAFARTVDGLSDVVPQRRTVARLAASIASVSVDAGELGDGIAARGA